MPITPLTDDRGSPLSDAPTEAPADGWLIEITRADRLKVDGYNPQLWFTTSKEEAIAHLIAVLNPDGEAQVAEPLQVSHQCIEYDPHPASHPRSTGGANWIAEDTRLLD